MAQRLFYLMFDGVMEPHETGGQRSENSLPDLTSAHAYVHKVKLQLQNVQENLSCL